MNSSTSFEVPEVVSTAGTTPQNVSQPFLVYFLISKGTGEKIILYLHFTEVQTLRANDTREFNIVWDGNIIHEAYSPKMLQSDTKYNILPITCSKTICFLSLVRTQRSTLPPLINAIESFRVLEFPYAETNPNDGRLLLLQTGPN